MAWCQTDWDRREKRHLCYNIIIRGAENNPVSTIEHTRAQPPFFSRKISCYRSNLEWLWLKDRQRDKSSWRHLSCCMYVLPCYHVSALFIHAANTFWAVYLLLENIVRTMPNRNVSSPFFSKTFTYATSQLIDQVSVHLQGIWIQFFIALDVLTHSFKNNLQEERNRHTATNKDKKAEQMIMYI